ncbi:MAG TPA: DmsE family decaheme c-type cytochrome [Syntrophorhabdaceae bacterium]|jgi:DmsE family decaheme c-type cytochrome
MRRFAVPAIYVFILYLLSAFFSAEMSYGAPDYIGSDACKSCHANYVQSYAESIHGKTYVPGSPAKEEGCETCHGPGASHVKRGGGKGTMFAFGPNPDAREKTAKCLKCHEDSPKQAFWNMSKHKSSGLSCDTCHVVHTGMKPLRAPSGYLPLPAQRKTMKAPMPDLCFGCHKDVRSQTLRQSHHPIREGKTGCSACHEPHGAFGPKMVKADSINELCYKCHAEKRGPFMVEHPPVAENCLNCHVAHGSNHSALLTRKTPQLCQSCHDFSQHPGTPYTSFETFRGPAPSNRMVSRNCVLCHTNVHGTNSPTDRGQRFLR